jgi:adenosylhomocysteine nucleosidase
MIALCAAMELEIKAFSKKFHIINQEQWNHAKIYTASVKDRDVLICSTGVGKVLSAVLTERLLSNYSVSHLLFTGLAGSLNPRYAIGDIVLAADFLQWDFDATAFSFEVGEIPYTGYRIFKSDPSLIEAAESSSPKDFRLHKGRFLTGDTFITGNAKQRNSYLTKELKGDVIDMETAAAGMVAKLHHVPFLGFKLISDRADGESPRHFLRFARKASERLLQFSRCLLDAVS